LALSLLESFTLPDAHELRVEHFALAVHVAAV
jgi:hypothetical protein